MPLLLLDHTLPEPAANLALDEALLLEAEEGRRGEVLRFWELPNLAVVLGAGGSVSHDVNVAASEADRVPILRRASGGGTVLLGPGCLCYSLILRTDRAPGLSLIPPSTRYVMERGVEALRGADLDASIQGISDLVIAGRKISGSAQQRKQRHFLHHGTFLAGFDLDLVTRYLLTPERQPEYRRGRGHAEFLGNLPLTTSHLKELLIGIWKPEGHYGPVPIERIRELVDARYGRVEWSRRR